VLDELGYLDGDAVTPDGRRLARLYSELDLLAAECLRRGIWEGLNPAELAACVSVLSFESRQVYDEGPPDRLPKGPIRDVLGAMMRTWADLDQLEKRSGLSFLREPDAGFVWAAFRWARGAKLEDVLDSADGLTPGDFVRSVKQLIDLLDQIAAAADQSSPSPRANLPTTPAEDSEQPRPEVPPRDRDVAATARAAISALRRGVVAYTSLTD
jgi:ATP-dependent RNA helicase HelY